MKQILPIVMNTSFQKLAVIDFYTSFIWTTRYYDVGDFELCVPADPSNFDLFQKGYYIAREDDENTGIIESVTMESNADGEELMIVKGRFLGSILGRRIIAVQTTINSTIKSGVNTLINQNVINPSITTRKISNFILGSYTISAQSIQAQYTGKNLLETIVDICKTYGIGFKVILNNSNKFVFTLYEGVDHTYNQDTLPYVIFSDKYDNLLSSKYEENYQNISTAVLVAGEGEGLNRKTVWVSSGETGLNRYEVYDDSRNTRSNDGEISDADYTALLQEAGKERLTQYTAAFSGEVLFDNVNYKTDVNVGDLVVIENSKWGIYMNTRLVEVIESVNAAGEYSIVPTFGV